MMDMPEWGLESCELWLDEGRLRLGRLHAALAVHTC